MDMTRPTSRPSSTRLRELLGDARLGAGRLLRAASTRASCCAWPHEVLGDALRRAHDGVADDAGGRPRRRARGSRAPLGVAHVVVDTDELAIPGYAENPVNRCFFCKDNLYDICDRGGRSARGIADGRRRRERRRSRATTVPGLAAAARARASAIRSSKPALTKADIRAASRALGPADLGPAGQPVPLVALSLRHADHATSALARVAAAEDALRALGFRELRVRASTTRSRASRCPPRTCRASSSRRSASG